MSKIEEIFGQFRSEAEKDDMLAAQFSTIASLNRQIEELKAEKKQLEANFKVSKVQTPQNIEEIEPYELQICREQLRLLRDLSLDRELTAEEARKTDIYAKILLQSKPSTKKNSSLDGKSTAELLKLVQEDADGLKVN
jgi:hypothetical protein